MEDCIDQGEDDEVHEAMDPPPNQPMTQPME